MCNAFYARDPAQCGIALYHDYEGQVTEQPTWMVMGAINLAGVTTTEHGFVIWPHLARLSLRLPDIGVARAPRLLRGYVRIARTERLTMTVRDVPPTARAVVTWSDGRAVRFRRAGDGVVFALPASAGRAADWAVSWR